MSWSCGEHSRDQRVLRSIPLVLPSKTLNPRSRTIMCTKVAADNMWHRFTILDLLLSHPHSCRSSFSFSTCSTVPRVVPHVLGTACADAHHDVDSASRQTSNPPRDADTLRCMRILGFYVRLRLFDVCQQYSEASCLEGPVEMATRVASEMAVLALVTTPVYGMLVSCSLMLNWLLRTTLKRIRHNADCG